MNIHIYYIYMYQRMLPKDFEAWPYIAYKVLICMPIHKIQLKHTHAPPLMAFKLFIRRRLEIGPMRQLKGADQRIQVLDLL